MSRILKSIAPYWKSIIIILLLLVLQANCDLALPQYTSNIIDVGIQNGGIGHSIPEKITKDEYDIAKMFMTAIRVVTRARARVLPSREMDQTALRLHLLKITVMR